ncbi:MAG: hypothetical protein HFH38_08595 [Lachnospiraceae bacterium]|jgi:chromosome segregation ATPase|nr:hypothetical protein [Lachnospiraceae bacterium]
MAKKKGTDPRFERIAQSKDIPILVLDQKWHHLFSVDGKPKEIQRLEKKVNKHLARQGRLNQDMKELKGLKHKLMKNIMVNMDEIGEEGQETPKLREDRRLITEINDRMDGGRSEIKGLEEELRADNERLMAETISYCYGLMNQYEAEREEIASWLRQTRMELKRKVIRKESIEDKNKEIYTYLHDIFGARITETFDVRYWAEYK